MTRFATTTAVAAALMVVLLAATTPGATIHLVTHTFDPLEG